MDKVIAVLSFLLFMAKVFHQAMQVVASVKASLA